MLRSLVGSEMCIRDRSQLVVCVRRPAPRPDRFGVVRPKRLLFNSQSLLTVGLRMRVVGLWEHPNTMPSATRCEWTAVEPAQPCPCSDIRKTTQHHALIHLASITMRPLSSRSTTKSIGHRPQTVFAGVTHRRCDGCLRHAMVVSEASTGVISTASCSCTPSHPCSSQVPGT